MCMTQTCRRAHLAVDNQYHSTLCRSSHHAKSNISSAADRSWTVMSGLHVIWTMVEHSTSNFGGHMEQSKYLLNTYFLFFCCEIGPIFKSKVTKCSGN
jgi:hypothetical protein